MALFGLCVALFLAQSSGDAAASAASLGAVSAAAPAPALDTSRYIPKNLRPYVLAFFVTPAVRKEMPSDLFIRHQQYIRTQLEAGIYRVVGPITDGGRLRGLMVVAAKSTEEVRKIVENDPAVREGVFEVEVHPAMFPSLDGIKVEYPQSN